MDTKYSEKQQTSTPTKNKISDPARLPSKKYFAILALTIILLLAFTVSFFAVFSMPGQGLPYRPQSNNNSGYNDFSGGDGENNNSGSVIGGGRSVGGNAPGKTVAKRSSYKISTDQNVRYITDAISAKQAILVDLDTYTSIAEKGADTKIYPASMTKVMSLLVACERLKSLTTKLTVTKEISDYAYKMGGSQFGVKIGDELDTQDLLYLTSYYSDTVAVIMLANHIAGSEEKFVDMMNEKARSLGLSNTNFDNCTGLHSSNNYTTCREMAVIMAYALDNPLCKELLTNTESYKMPTNSNTYTLWGPSWYRDRLSSKPTLETVRVSGGKTGYIDESGYCLVSYAVSKSSGKKYVQVVVGEKSPGADAKAIYNNYAK